jgi:alpha-1,3-mannosyltransferase
MLVAAQAAVLCYQLGLDLLGALAFRYRFRLLRTFYKFTLLSSVAVSVKMPALLYVPGLLVILFKARGLTRTIRQILIILATQVLFALVFLLNQPWSYLRRAFDFSRAFLYMWTVNWKFVSEETFLNRQWAISLLVGHVFTLVAFGLFRWCRKDGGVWRVLNRGIRRPTFPAGMRPVTSDCRLLCLDPEGYQPHF